MIGGKNEYSDVLFDRLRPENKYFDMLCDRFFSLYTNTLTCYVII